MSLVTLADILPAARDDGTAVAGLVVQGWEDARAYVRAAESLGRPVILQAGPGCRAHTPLRVMAAMFRHLAEAASVPVVAHLDHADSLETCRAAIGEGFSSVMYDGSALPLAENTARTAAVVDLARTAGVSVEAELGFVGYAGGAASRPTDPAEAARFARDTGIDALAVSVGNTHLMTEGAASLDHDALAAIARACPDLALVLHGGSGIDLAERRRIAASTTVAKVNIGTELRQAFGAALRGKLAADPAAFDRIAILKATEPALEAAAREAIASLMPA